MILRPHPSFAGDELQKKHLVSSKNDSYLHEKLQVHKVNVKKMKYERTKKEISTKGRSILFVNIRFIKKKA
jgi:hypothetical protein